MKLGGKEIKGPNIQTIIIPREPDPIVLTAQAVLDYDLFEKLCPRPAPPVRMKRGGTKVADMQDPRFLLALETYGRKRVSWIVLESLRLGTPDLTWDTVDAGDSNTWQGYMDELKSAGFSWAEIELIVDGCMSANALNESKIEAARSDFLLSMSQEAAEELSSLPDGQPSTPSGEAANA